MPPKQRITREMILEKAFDMFCSEGMDSVNARSVAKALKCSTQPIFSYYSGMDELKQCVEEQAQVLYSEHMNAAAQEHPEIENACVAFIRFAVKYPQMFYHMFLHAADSGKAREDAGNYMHTFEEPLAAENGLNLEQAHHVAVYMWLYTYGLAAAQASGQCDYCEEEMRTHIKRMKDMMILGEKQNI